MQASTVQLVCFLLCSLYKLSLSQVCSNGQLRLVGRAVQTQGRVEVCNNNTWGTVCDDNWSSQDAMVVCKQLGYPSGGAQSYSFATFGKGSGPIWLSDVHCSGAEISLQSCFKGPIGAAYCSHQEDAGVSCNNASNGSTPFPVQDKDYLPFISLGTTAGVPTQSTPRVDDGFSSPIYISPSFPLSTDSGTQYVDTAYVGTNGYFSFNQGVSDYRPQLFPYLNFYLVAPFWADIYIVNGPGQILYEVHATNTSLLSLMRVSGFISSQLGISFHGSWMLVAHYDQVLPFGVTNSTATNTFQAILISDGSQSYAVFTYKCGLMRWSGRATIGFGSTGKIYKNHPLSGTTNDTLVACLNMPATNWSNLIYPLSDASVQPPIFEFVQSNIALVNMPVSIFLNVSVPPYSISQGLSAVVTVIPNAAYFNRGYFNGYSWTFAAADFGMLQLYLPSQFVGPVQLNATAYNGLVPSYGYLSINILAVSTPPNLTVETPPCYNKSAQVIYLSINTSLVDTNASEILNVYISNVPENITILNFKRNSNNEYSYNVTKSLVTQLEIVGDLETVGLLNLSVSAQAVPLSNGIKSYNNVSVVLNACEYCSDGDVRLVGGSSPKEGRVEVCFNRSWGGICSSNYYYWGLIEVVTVCKQLGFYPYNAVNLGSGFFGAGPTNYYLSVDYCDSRAQGLLDCYYYQYGYYYYSSVATLGSYSCVYGVKDFSVACLDPSPEYCSGDCINGTIRLVNGSTPNEGRIEVCKGGCWGTVCGYGFSFNEASVVCRQLGFRSDGPGVGYYGSGSGPVWLYGLSCSGNESSLFDCGLQINYDDQLDWCNHNNDVGVFCRVFSNCTDGDVRLVNGLTSMDGIVELCYSNEWGTICDGYHWTADPSAADTVCKQLGYSGNSAVPYANYSGQPQHTVWGDIHCDARAKSLLDCISGDQIGFNYYGNCDIGIVGVTCQENNTRLCEEGSVQLVGGSTPNEGRVLVCGRGRWGSVCGNYWDSLDAAVVCNQLGYPSLGAFSYSNNGQYYNTYGLPIWLYNLNCSGSENNLFNCSIVNVSYEYCDHNQDATVKCPDQSPAELCSNGTVRLVGGSVPSEGRVEICYNGHWGTMCGYNSFTSYANVICKQLGYSPYGASVYQYSYYGQGSGGIFLYAPTLLCIGNERTLLDCYHAPIGYHQCSDHSRDIGISCQTTFNNISECRSGSIRLVGGNYVNEGTVEICIGDRWSTLCGYYGGWNDYNSLVLCKQLGLNPSSATTYYYSYFGQGTGNTLQLQAACTGNESSIFQCPPSASFFQQYSYSCYYHYYDIGIQCLNQDGSVFQCTDGDVRLVNGNSAGDGVVEVCYQNQWSAICGDYAWTDDTSGATTVCKQLGYNNTIGVPYDQYGYYGPTYISNVHCDSRKSRLIDCNHQEYLSYCYSVAAVRCQDFTRQCEDGSVYLAGGPTPYEGRVQVCGNGIWGTVCSSGWDSLDAAVVCRQLGYGDIGAIAFNYGSTSGPIWLQNLTCSGNEQNLLNCQVSNITAALYCSHNNDPGVSCPGSSPVLNCTDGDVRLVGGYTPSEGRVELCYRNHWGTICGQYGVISTYSNVICRQLGFSPFYANVYYYSYYGQGSGGIFLYTQTLLCFGDENTLLDCHHAPIGYHECNSHYYDIGLQCQVSTNNISECSNGDIHLLGGITTYEGRVEFCIGNQWISLCGYPWSWDSNEAVVLCNHFGLQSSDPVVTFNSHFGQGTGISLQILPHCSGNEGSLFACPSYDNYNGQSYLHFDTCYDRSSIIGVRCGNRTVLPLNCSDGDIRLTDGDSELDGRVEVCYGNQWGTICGDYSWIEDTSAANTVCKQLGYSPVHATPYEISFPQVGYYMLLLSNVHCDFRTSRLLDCIHYPLNSSYCYSGVAGVTCQVKSNTTDCTEGSIRLVGGPTPYEGRVEVCGQGTWGTICSGFNSLVDGSVVCNQLGFPTYGPIVYTYPWQYGYGSGPIWLFNIDCNGNERRVVDCPVNNNNNDVYCNHYSDISVKCQAPLQNCTNGDVRLVGGNDPSIGRVEMCYNQQWGTICGQSYGTTSFSNVICRQLGYSPYNANIYYYSTYGQGTGGIFLDTLHLLCTGNETTLLDCYHAPVGYYQCGDHYGDIAIGCQAISAFVPECENGAIHLVGGFSNYEGRVEYCIGGLWTTLCAYPWSWNSSNSVVICKELGFNSSSAETYFYSYFGYVIGPSLRVQPSCTGNETSIFKCRDSYSNYKILSFEPCYDYSYNLGIQCQELCQDGDVMLVNGTTKTEGRVQFCYNGHWRSIYAHQYAHWRTSEANVVCRQLGYATSGAIIYRDDRYGHGSGQEWLTYVACTGYESELKFCQYQINSGYPNTPFYYSVSMRCKESCNECLDGSIHLVGGATMRDGRLEVCISGCWTSVCISQQGWSAQDAAVACKQLQLNFSVAVPRYYYIKFPSPGLTPQCIGNETSLFQCAQAQCHNGEYNAAGVQCSEITVQNASANYTKTASLSPYTVSQFSSITLAAITPSFPPSISQSLRNSPSTLGTSSNSVLTAPALSMKMDLSSSVYTNQPSYNLHQSSSLPTPEPTSTNAAASTVQSSGAPLPSLSQAATSAFVSTIYTATPLSQTSSSLMLQSIIKTIQNTFSGIPNSLFSSIINEATSSPYPVQISPTPSLQANVSAFSTTKLLPISPTYGGNSLAFTLASSNPTPGLQMVSISPSFQEPTLKTESATTDSSSFIPFPSYQMAPTTAQGIIISSHPQVASSLLSLPSQTTPILMATDQASVSISGTIAALLKSTLTSSITVSYAIEMQPTPILQTSTKYYNNTASTTTVSSHTDQNSLLLTTSPSTSDVYSVTSSQLVIETSALPAPSSSQISMDIFNGDLRTSSLIQSTLGVSSIQRISITESFPSSTPAPTTGTPVLAFVVNPSYSNGSIFISWVVEKDIYTQCTLITHTSVLHPPCVDSFSATDLMEGIYTLIITANSATGSTLSIAHSWTVDLTPPVLVLTSYPSASVYSKEWNFTFNCINELVCNYWCNLQFSTTEEKYVSCNEGYFIAQNLEAGQDYTFSVYAVDGVGNVGSPANYNWKFSPQATSDKITEQSYMVYGIIGGIALVIITLIVIITCSLMIIRRRSRNRMTITRSKSQLEEHSLRPEKDKMFLLELQKKVGSDTPSSTFVIENEYVTNL